MKFVRVFLLLLVGSCLPLSSGAQQSFPSVPRLVNFSGRINDPQGRAVPGMAGVTFAIYRDQHEGAPLWMETQNVQADGRGAYTVQLGATRSEGLPLELFTSGEARWLGVCVNGQEEQPRVLLLSVPYALKAADAATIGGLPPSAFVLASPASASAAPSTSNSSGDALSPTLGGSGTLNFVPLWTPDGNTLGNSALFQSGTQIGINTTTPAATLDVNGPVISRGVLQLLSTGTATVGGGFSSQPLYLQGSAFNSSTQQPVNQVFQWQTEPAGNNSSNPSGTLNLLYGSGSNSPGETGLNIASNGKITFVSGQTFPGTGTITGITAGTGLTGGGTSGNVTLSINIPFANQFYAQLGATNTFTKNQVVNANLTAKQLISTATQGTAPLQVTSTTVVPNLNASLLGGLSASAFQPAGSYASLGTNTFTGTQTISSGDLSLTTGSLNLSDAGVVNLGGAMFVSASSSLFNTSVGLGTANPTLGSAITAVGSAALGVNTTGADNTATGAFALQFNTTGNGNTSTGFAALELNTTGSDNTATGSSALQFNTGDGNTATGTAALASNTTGGDNTATGVSGLQGNTTGSGNTAAGFAALANNTTGTDDTAVGIDALRVNTTGNFNTALGAEAGETTNSTNTTGSANTFLGASTNSGTQTNLSNATAIGAFAQVTTSNAMVLGSIAGVNNSGADTFVGIGTTAPTAKLDVRGTANFSGAVTFAPGQVFPGTGTITGVTAGTDLLGGGSSGGVSLSVDTTKVVTGVTAGTNLTGGGTGGVLTLNLDTTKVPQLATANTFAAAQTIGSGDLSLINGNLILPFTTGAIKLGNSPFISAPGNKNTALGVSGLSSNVTGQSNTAVGNAALPDGRGSFNTAVGGSALLFNTASNNTAVGQNALGRNDSGASNTGLGFNAGVPTGNGLTTGSNNTFVGANSNPGTLTILNNATVLGANAQVTFNNATAIGANAQVTANNAMVLGSINGVNGATADTFVGIGITAPTHKFHVGAGNNAFRVEGPPQGTTSPIVASFGGTGDFRIDAVGIGGGRFLVKDSGFVGINTTVPDTFLSVNGSADKPGGGSWATFSDRRLKNLDGNFDSGLSQILKLHPIRYRYKEENALGIQDHEEHVGFVAQDVQKVIPEAVTENSKGYLLVNNDPILWTMLNAIKEQQREIKQQQNQITALRTQLRERAAKDALLESRLAQIEQHKAGNNKLALARTAP